MSIRSTPTPNMKHRSGIIDPALQRCDMFEFTGSHWRRLCADANDGDQLTWQRAFVSCLDRGRRNLDGVLRRLPTGNRRERTAVASQLHCTGQLQRQRTVVSADCTVHECRVGAEVPPKRYTMYAAS